MQRYPVNQRVASLTLASLFAAVAPQVAAEPDASVLSPCRLDTGAVAADAASPVAAPGQCGLEWVEGVASPGMDHRVFALAVFDDGSGPALYAGGAFVVANEVSASRIAKWDGAAWSPLGLGVDVVVLGLEVFDPPGVQGPGLYVCGGFVTAGGNQTLRIARWDGAMWSPLGSGAQGTVDRMTVHDDGQGGGPALYVGGQFVQMGGVPDTLRIARWNGSTWSALGTGIEEAVNDLLAFDEDGEGPDPPRLFAGGYFLSAGGVEARYIARWDGSAWSDVGGATALNEHVHAFEVFDDGSGPALYVGGHFTAVHGVPARAVAKWDGTSWSPVGNGFNGEVLTITTFDDGSGAGPQLYVGGFFTAAFGGAQARFVAKWTGTAWVGLDTGLNDAVWALTTFDDGTGHGTALYAGGWFTTAGGLISRRVAQWDGLGSGPAISEHPSDLSVPDGAAAVFSVGATGTPPLSYQWRQGKTLLLDGGNISGATEAVLTIDPVGPADAGAYDVIVTSDCGVAVTDPATLTVTGPACVDLDDDGDVDANDYNSFAGCLAGPGGGIPAGCAAADCDLDLDIDLAEFAIFQASFTSP